MRRRRRRAAAGPAPAAESPLEGKERININYERVHSVAFMHAAQDE